MLTETRDANTAAIETAPDSEIASPEELQLAELIVATLNLDVAAVDISPNAPLYGEGLGLDSIDILELALVISKNYGIQLRPDDENNMKVFSSLRSLNRHIQQYRSK
jgi:acyl carrier protein